MSVSVPAPQSSRFARLEALLAHDPDNPNLLADTVRAAMDEGLFAEGEAMLDAAAARAPLPSQLVHLHGLAAMRLEAWDRAADRFAALLAEGADAPPVRYNLAWSLAMAKRFEEALPLLDEATGAAIPQAAELEVELLHQLGEHERAGERARALLAIHPEHRGLNAAVSTLAIDLEDKELALRAAQRAGDHPEALVTLGTLALGEDQPEAAARLFDAALARDPQAPRAWVGRGLVRLLSDDKARAAQELDRGAELFGSHIGSWIAAGWAHVVAGDLATARRRFETALALDESFGESQGAIGVMDLLEGRIDEARHRTEVARRLDRTAFSVALATMLLAAGEGDKDKARRIFELALAQPIGADGRTLAQSLARLGGGLG